MKIHQIAKIRCGQDGAIYGTELFRFEKNGDCAVYEISDLLNSNNKVATPIGEFTLDRANTIAPHSNAVCFGCEFYDESDRYPLLYTNIYNNYSKTENKMIGICLVYRIMRNGNSFSSTLVQIIEIGFYDDAMLWKASTEKHGVRPYGNFLVDVKNRSYIAYVMRNELLGTRYFRFSIPSVHDGGNEGDLNVKKVVLKKSDILEYFDCNYHRYIQGGIVHNDKVYSTEGFCNDKINRPAIRVIDLSTKQEELFDILDAGLVEEPEFIDFYNDRCLYSDNLGNLYEVEF